MYHLTRKSGNKKTGSMPVSTTSRAGCPATCPLYSNGCYGDSGPIAIHWRKVTSGERSIPLDSFVTELSVLPTGSAYRHNQVGDFAHKDGYIVELDFKAIVKAALRRKLRTIAYTHHNPEVGNNGMLLRDANLSGFTINLSANNVAEAVSYREVYGMPVVTLLPQNAPNVQHVEGHKVVACPAEKSDKVTCETCMLCADSRRDYIIGFRAHGTGKRKAERIAINNI